MKVSSIDSMYYSQNLKDKGFDYAINSIKLNNSSMKNINFGISYTSWSHIGHDLLKMNRVEINDIAEFFHKSDKNILKEVSTAENFIGWISDNKSVLAFEKLDGAVEKVKQHKDTIIRELSQLKQRGQKANNEKIKEHKNELQRLDNKAGKVEEKFTFINHREIGRAPW